MGEELNTQQVDAEAGAAPEAGASTEPAASELSTTTEATTGTPDEIQAKIDAAVAAVIDRYERKGDGHLAKLRSTKDKQIAALERQLRQQTTVQLDKAKALIDDDPAQAAQILAGIVEAQAQASFQDNQYQELVDWQYKILEDLGADPEDDEEAAELAAGWTEQLLENPSLTWDFQQDAARLQLERERKATKEATKELAELKESLPELIKAQVTQALVGAGIVPDTGEGGTPAQQQDTEWRNKPSGQLIRDGLAARMKTPIQRT